VRYAETKGIKRRNILIQKSHKLLERNIYGNIIYNMLGKESYIKFFNNSDATVKRAIQILEKGESFPKAPANANQPKTKNEGKKKRTAQADSRGESQVLRLYAERSFC
jgi:carboxyl-terminal processing protease